MQLGWTVTLVAITSSGPFFLFFLPTFSFLSFSFFFIQLSSEARTSIDQLENVVVSSIRANNKQLSRSSRCG